MPTLHVKILSLRPAQRYVLRRIVLVAERDLHARLPDLKLAIEEIGDPSQIGRYSTALVQPSLVVEEQTVCSGRLPGTRPLQTVVSSITRLGCTSAVEYLPIRDGSPISSIARARPGRCSRTSRSAPRTMRRRT
jgi:hypothetical protein